MTTSTINIISVTATTLVSTPVYLNTLNLSIGSLTNLDHSATMQIPYGYTILSVYYCLLNI